MEHVDLTGKTVVIVGANIGLGFEIAKHFALMDMGSRVPQPSSAQMYQLPPWLTLLTVMTIPHVGMTDSQPRLNYIWPNTL